MMLECIEIKLDVEFVLCSSDDRSVINNSLNPLVVMESLVSWLTDGLWSQNVWVQP